MPGEERAYCNLIITFVACTGTAVGGVPCTPLHAGKSRHYSCEIAHVAVAAQPLSQPTPGHGRETDRRPAEVPAMDNKTEMEFEWNQELQVPDSAGEALEFMRSATAKYGNTAQPLWSWPVASSVLYWMLSAGGERHARVLVFTVDAIATG